MTPREYVHWVMRVNGNLHDCGGVGDSDHLHSYACNQMMEKLREVLREEEDKILRYER